MSLKQGLNEFKTREAILARMKQEIIQLAHYVLVLIGILETANHFFVRSLRYCVCVSKPNKLGFN